MTKTTAQRMIDNADRVYIVIDGRIEPVYIEANKSDVSHMIDNLLYEDNVTGWNMVDGNLYISA